MVCMMENPEEWYRRFSSYMNMFRVTARIRRWLCSKGKEYMDFISTQELNGALYAIVKQAQKLFFVDLVQELHQRKPVSSKSLRQLCPFLDFHGIVRVGGRLRNSSLPDNQKYPILIPKESHLALLIARHWHSFACHAGPRLVTALINQRFWIVGIRLVVHRAIRECITCVKFTGANPQPVMADLPAARVQGCQTFSKVGMDYAGPITMKETSLRRSRVFKVYIALFVCMTTKAVHLELVLDLTTKAFLAALDRFAARRGLPSALFSDCGTNFVGASNQLRKLVNDPANRDILTAQMPVEWNFNPPSAPHFGGLWEAAVKSTKSLMVSTMGAQVWSLEEFSTILCRIEAALNSRPLTQMSSDPNDLEYLTPGHFIIGRSLLAAPEEGCEDKKLNLRHRWKVLQQSFQFFWRRWSAEYLSTLQACGRWQGTQPNVKVGEMVVLKDKMASPLTWKLGRVKETLPGDDEVVRVVKVLTSQGLLVRPVVKLVLLPTD
ncbi:uncharacterized protein LOC126908249 [Daktulosphaira vitifoliae]|uniref:uncharacterized protein LOC126908249 n=1 Tax=Daktulosphaira vitifoliae TaxID=58002 RepID=UPI0021AA8FE7|nr:uncharacterized protein LOC126908249 [Daktulosphaira vitifoliae]